MKGFAVWGEWPRGKGGSGTEVLRVCFSCTAAIRQRFSGMYISGSDGHGVVGKFAGEMLPDGGEFCFPEVCWLAVILPVCTDWE